MADAFGEEDVLDVVAVERVDGAAHRPEPILTRVALVEHGIFRGAALGPQLVTGLRLLGLVGRQLDRRRPRDRLAGDLLPVLVKQRRRVLGQDRRPGTRR